MSMLRKLLKKDNDETISIPQPPAGDIRVYTNSWLGKVSLAHTLEPSDDTNKVEKILTALNNRDGQCPCGGSGSQYKCPCVKIRENGICTCGLFKSIPPRKISGSTTASVKRNDE